MRDKLIECFLILGSFLLVLNNSFSQSEPRIFDGVTTALLQQLSSDDMQGRDNNTPGFDLASKVVVGFMKNNGIRPLMGDTYFDSLNFSDYEGYNILGLVGDFDIFRPTIVLGAHLDHIGASKGSIYNGANDNATGVVAALQVASYLSNFQFDQNIIIALFTAEEDGLLGSKDLARKLQAFGIKPKLMINFEMLGVPMSSKNLDQVYLTGYHCSNLAQVANDLLGFSFIVDFPEEKNQMVFRRSDNFSFFEEFDIPAQTLCSYTFKNYPNYHQPGDDFSEIDLKFLNQTINHSAEFIKELLSKNIEVKFYKKLCSEY